MEQQIKSSNTTNIVLAIIFGVLGLIFFGVLIYYFFRTPKPVNSVVNPIQAGYDTIRASQTQINQKLDQLTGTIQKNVPTIQSSIQTAQTNIQSLQSSLTTLQQNVASIQQIQASNSQLIQSVLKPVSQKPISPTRTTFAEDVMNNLSGIQSYGMPSRQSSPRRNRFVPNGTPQKKRRMFYLPNKKTKNRSSLIGCFLDDVHIPMIDQTSITSFTKRRNGMLISSGDNHSYLSYVNVKDTPKNLSTQWMIQCPMMLRELVTLSGPGTESYYAVDTSNKMYQIMIDNESGDTANVNFSPVPLNFPVEYALSNPENSLMALIGNGNTYVFEKNNGVISLKQQLPCVVASISNIQNGMYDVITLENGSLVLQQDKKMPLNGQVMSIFNNDNVVFALNNDQAKEIDNIKYIHDLDGYFFLSKPSEKAQVIMF